MTQIVFHFSVYFLALVGLRATVAKIPQVRRDLRKRSHDELMKRIAELERAVMGDIVYALDWIESQPKRMENGHLSYIGKWQCYGCGTWTQANGNGYHHLCRRCGPKEVAA